MKYEPREYGLFSNDMWHSLNGLESVQHIIKMLKEEIVWGDYQLWVHGTILNNIETWDMDLTIIGPSNPEKINELLEAVVQIGFREKHYLDVKCSLSGELYDPVNDTTKNILYACYKPSIKVNGKEFKYGTGVCGLWLKETRYPMQKRRLSSIVLKSPVRLI